MKKHIFISVILAILLLGAGYAAYGTVKNSPAKQTFEEGWTEPEFAGAGNATVSVRYPKNLQAIVDYADTIISGEIVAIHDTETTFMMEEGTPERAVSEKIGAGPSFTVRGRDIVISVEDTLKGKMNGNEITLNIYNTDVPLDPEVKVGEHYIFFLTRDEETGKYKSTLTAGYFKIDKSRDEVRPLYTKAPDFSELENRSYEHVKKKIKEKLK